VSKKNSSSPLLRATRLNAARRAASFARFRDAGAAWMVECRDLWDSEDDDAGVYFEEFADGYKMNEFIEGLDPSSDRILGIYDLSKPLDPQGPGLTLEEWLAR
jgi:hypothetical protein